MASIRNPILQLKGFSKYYSSHFIFSGYKETPRNPSVFYSSDFYKPIHFTLIKIYLHYPLKIKTP